jgi:peptide/nickel transport system permease protein
MAAAPGGKRPRDDGRAFSGLVWRRLRWDQVLLAALGVIVVVAVAAVLAPRLAPYDPTRADPRIRLSPPGTVGHLLGTDQLGRDVLSRVMWGGRISLIVGIVPVVLSAVGGTAVGLIAGYYGGPVDQIITRALDVLFAFPAILLALAIVSALGPSIYNAMLAITIVAIPSFARLVRSAVLGLRERSFVEAARSLGANSARIISRHILPNTVSPVIVYATFETGKTIVFAAALSFLGLGVQPPTAEWGAMLSQGRTVLATAWYVATVPGILIFLVSLSFNILGDGLRDALDPHQAAAGPATGAVSAARRPHTRDGRRRLPVQRRGGGIPHGAEQRYPE